MKRLWSAEAGFFLGIWLLLMIVGQSRMMRDPGMLWHTVCGERMLSTGELIRADPFSFTLRGEPWIPHQWLGEIVLALLYRQGELDTQLLAAVTLLAALYAWISHRLLRSGLHWTLVIVAIALTLMASTSHFHVRPHLTTIALLAWTMACLIDFERGRIEAASLLWLVPIYVLWTNLHGGMLGGLVTMAVTVCGWLLWRLLGWQSPIHSWQVFVLLIVVIVLCTATMVVNPYGLELPGMWFRIMGMPLGNVIQEHAPLQVDRIEGQGVLAFAAFYVVLLLSVVPRRWRVTWLVPLLWLMMTLKGIRHAPLFAATAILAIADFFPSTVWARWLGRPGSDLYAFPTSEPPSRPVAWASFALPAAVVMTSFLLQRFEVRVPAIGRGWAHLDATRVPLGLQDKLRSLPEGTKILNDLNFGGFLIAFAPNIRVSVDDRCELYGYDILLDNYRLQTDDPDRLKDFYDRYKFNYVLVEANSPLDLYLARHEAWMLEAEDPVAKLYHRRTQKD